MTGTNDQTGNGSQALPPYARYLWSFGFMNAVNYTIALGAPMVLCARFLNASESLIGFLLALTPLFTTLQLPAARYVDRLGHQRLMMAGWRIRAFMVLGMVPLPLLVGIVPKGMLLFFLTALLMAFNVIRGFASGAWLPWVKHIISSSLLGRYFSIESIVGNTAALLTLAASSLVLGHNPAGWQYAILLAISGAAGIVSVVPLAKAPAAATSGEAGEPESLWTITRRVWDIAEYRRLVRFAVVNSFALGAASGFTVLFLKEIVGFGEGRVVMLSAAGLVGAMTGAFFLGRYIDNVGSRPVMRVAGWGHIVYFASIAAYAAFGATSNFVLFAVVMGLGGILANANGVATGRLILNTCPREDLTVAMAVSQVGMSLASGIATVAWGFALEWLRAGEWFGHVSRWPFVIFYFVILAFVIFGQFMLSHVHEAQAMPANRFIRALLLEWPQRLWADKEPERET